MNPLLPLYTGGKCEMAAKEKPSHDQTSEGSEPGSLEKSVVDNLASARETLAAIDALNVRWKVKFK